MSSSPDFINYVLDQISKSGSVSSRKMFGEYMIYLNTVPVLLVCDNTVYAKMIEELIPILPHAKLGIPYPNAKQHYIVDIDDANTANQVVQTLFQNRIKSPSKKDHR